MSYEYVVAQATEDGFCIGDIVTRDGTDRQVVIYVIDDKAMKVVCVTAPTDGWCNVGEIEDNKSSRYSLVTKAHY